MLNPMLALMFWTLCVALYLLTLRIRAVRRGDASLGYFRLYTDAQKAPPAAAIAASKHYDNLFQVPVLFYLACVTALALGLPGAPVLAWAFVLLRLIHGFIHMSYNNVMHRLVAFLAGNLVLLGIWVLIALQVSSRG
ncbi:MAPEG family protein [Marinimicrobium locisalis]|uniref:MAPEG family protein n=1 Tax=Marinimicrobium locisalis TaxID=546022 RepID=UPI00322207DD